MTRSMRYYARPAAIAALFGLAGCVGAPAPGPVAGYPPAPGYGQPPIYAQPPTGYSQGGYAPGSQSGYAPGPSQQVALGGRCYAGIYTCDLPQALPVGSQCSCPGLGAPSYGNVR